MNGPITYYRGKRAGALASIVVLQFAIGVNGVVIANGE